MSIVNFVGFETGGTEECQAATGTYSIQGTTKKTGSYAAKFVPASGSGGYLTIKAPDSTMLEVNFSIATIYVGFWFYTETKPSTGGRVILWMGDSSSTMKANLQWDGNNKINLFDSAWTTLHTSSALSEDTWYYISVKVGTGSSGVAWEVKIDGTTSGSGTNANTNANNHAQISVGPRYDAASTVDFTIDDVVIDNANWPTSDMVVKRMAQDGNSASNTGWTANTGTKWEAVDEVPTDGDTTYLSTLSMNDDYTSTHASSTTAGISGTIHGVKQTTRMRSGGVVSVMLAQLLRSGSTDAASADSSHVTSYSSRNKLHLLDPTDSGSWTTAKLDALESGFRYTDGGEDAGYASTSVLSVLHTPSTGPAGKPYYYQRNQH